MPARVRHSLVMTTALTLAAGALVGTGVASRSGDNAQAAPQVSPRSVSNSVAAIVSEIATPDWMTGPVKDIAGRDDSMYVVSDDTLVELSPLTGAWGAPRGIAYIPRSGQGQVDDTVLSLAVSDDTVFVGLTEGAPAALGFGQFQGIRRASLNQGGAAALVANVPCNNTGTPLGLFRGVMSVRGDGRVAYGVDSAPVRCLGDRYAVGMAPVGPSGYADTNLGSGGTVGGVAIKDDTIYAALTDDDSLALSPILANGSLNNFTAVPVLDAPGPVTISSDDTIAVASTINGDVQLLHHRGSYTPTNWTTANASGTRALAFDDSAVLYAVGSHVAIKGFGAAVVDDSVALAGPVSGRGIAIWDRPAGSVAFVPYFNGDDTVIARVGLVEATLDTASGAVGSTVKVTITAAAGAPVDDSALVSATIGGSVAARTGSTPASGARQFDLTAPTGSGVQDVVLTLRGGNQVLAGQFTYPATPTPDPPAPIAPSAPRSVTLVPGDTVITATWEEPASVGTYPVSTYRATAAPGGATCLVSAPTTTCTMTGLTNGTAYTVRVEALNGAGWGASASAGPATPGGNAPGTPGTPTVLPGDGQATVVVTPPSTGGTPSAYVVTASPGGQTCQIGGSAGSCVVEALTNGTTYTFTVIATNAGGLSPSSPASAPVTPAVPITPRPETVPPLAPGEYVATEEGRPTPITVDPNQSETGIEVTGTSFDMEVAGEGSGGTPLPLDANGHLVLEQEGTAAANGDGFYPGSQVNLYLDPPTSNDRNRGAGRAQGTLMGTLVVKSDGTFAGSVPLPADLPLGDHVLQAAGVTQGNGTRAVSLGMTVVEDAATRPGPVREMRATGKTSTTITLRWSVPLSDGGAPVTSYRVRIRQSTDERYRSGGTTTSTRATVTKLKPGKLYYLRVKAVNAVGAGPAPEWIRVRTPRT